MALQSTRDDPSHAHDDFCDATLYRKTGELMEVSFEPTFVCTFRAGYQHEKDMKKSFREAGRDLAEALQEIRRLERQGQQAGDDDYDRAAWKRDSAKEWQKRVLGYIKEGKRSGKKGISFKIEWENLHLLQKKHWDQGLLKWYPWEEHGKKYVELVKQMEEYVDGINDACRKIIKANPGDANLPKTLKLLMTYHEQIQKVLEYYSSLQNAVTSAEESKYRYIGYQVLLLNLLSGKMVETLENQAFFVPGTKKEWQRRACNIVYEDHCIQRYFEWQQATVTTQGRRTVSSAAWLYGNAVDTSVGPFLQYVKSAKGKGTVQEDIDKIVGVQKFLGLSGTPRIDETCLVNPSTAVPLPQPDRIVNDTNLAVTNPEKAASDFKEKVANFMTTKLWEHLKPFDGGRERKISELLNKYTPKGTAGNTPKSTAGMPLMENPEGVKYGKIVQQPGGYFFMLHHTVAPFCLAGAFTLDNDATNTTATTTVVVEEEEVPAPPPAPVNNNNNRSSTKAKKSNSSSSSKKTTTEVSAVMLGDNSKGGSSSLEAGVSGIMQNVRATLLLQQQQQHDDDYDEAMKDLV